MRVEEYQLDLDVDYAAQSFLGHVVVRATDSDGPWELDAVDLEVERVWVNGAPTEFGLDAAAQKLRVPVDDRGEVRVAVDFSGKARREFLSGFYVSRFGERPLLTTMMEPVSCRRLLPCFDAPDQKAVFRLTVTTEKDLAVVSNGDLERTEVVDGRRRWTFAATPRMATYLLYLGVGPFEFREQRSGDVRVIAATSPGNSGRARQSLEMAGAVLRAYEAYYGLPYPLPKLHLIGVPDFATGAMENWGAIAFSEIGLLLDDSSTPAIVRWAVETLVHEIAHQWFGNLVTMYSFDDLWLNESFATFVATKMTEQLRLRGDPWAEFFIRTQTGWWGDSLASTHPIKTAIADTSQMAEIFDEITYFKGANVLRMVEAYLGEEAFRQGVTAYLTRYQYGNARGEDLWRALEEASEQPVARVMEQWVGRAGLPVVRVETGPDGVRLSQRRFEFLDPNPVDAPWPIPLTVLSDGHRSTHLFDTASMTLKLPSPQSVHINPGRTGFYRVLYDRPGRARRVAGLVTMPPADRWAFLNDASAFLCAGEYTLDEYLGIVRAAEPVADYASVMEVANALHLLWPVLESHDDFRDQFLRFYRRQLDRLGRVPRPGEPDLDPVVRQTILGGLVRCDPELARELAPRFGEIDRVDASLRPAIAYAFAKVHGAGAFDPLVQRLTSHASEDAAEGAARALAGFPDAPSLAAALARSLASDVRLSHTAYIVGGIAANPAGRAPAWRWMQDHLREFEKRVEGSDLLSRLLTWTVPMVGLVAPDEVREFFARERFAEAASGIRKGLEMLQIEEAIARRAAVPSAAPTVPR